MPTSSTTRRCAILAAGAALAARAASLAVPAARAAGPLETRTVEVAGVRDPQLGAQFAIAQELGYFKDAGLEVNTHWNQSAADTLTAMASGIGVGIGGIFTQVVFSSQSIPVRTISALADIAETSGIVLAPGVTLKSPAELEGRKLAYTQGNSQILILARLAERFGFDASKVTLVNMNQSEGIVAAARGDVAGLMGWQPNLYRLIKLGGTLYVTGTQLFVNGREEVLPFDERLQYNHSIVLATQDWVDTRPNTLRALLGALVRANDLIGKDQARAVAVMQNVLKIDTDALAVMVGANKYGLGLTDSLARSLNFQSKWAISVKRATSLTTPEQAFAPGVLAGLDPALVSWKPSA